MGAGAMTGRRMGYCTGNAVPGYASAPFAGGRFGGGGRRGHRNMFYATGLYGWQRAGFVPAAPAAISREREADVLKRQEEYLSSELEAIRKRLGELKEE